MIGLAWDLIWALLTLGWILLQLVVMLPIVIVWCLFMMLTACLLAGLLSCGMTRAEGWMNDVSEAGPWALDLLWGHKRPEDPHE